MSANDPSLTCEQLSAFLDGELPAHEEDLAIRRMTRDPELRATAIRYCLITDVIRGDLPDQSSLDLVDRVAEGMGPELEEVPAMPSPTAAPAAASGHWIRRLGGLAVAASVAGLAIVSLQSPDREGSAEPQLVVVPDASGPAPAAAFAQPRALARSAGNPDRLVSYYVSHVERVAPVGVQTGFSRIVMSEDRVSPSGGADDEPERQEDSPE